MASIILYWISSTQPSVLLNACHVNSVFSKMSLDLNLCDTVYFLYYFVFQWAHISKLDNHVLNQKITKFPFQIFLVKTRIYLYHFQGSFWKVLTLDPGQQIVWTVSFNFCTKVILRVYGKFWTGYNVNFISKSFLGFMVSSGLDIMWTVSFRFCTKVIFRVYGKFLTGNDFNLW